MPYFEGGRRVPDNNNKDDKWLPLQRWIMILAALGAVIYSVL